MQATLYEKIEVGEHEQFPGRPVIKLRAGDVVDIIPVGEQDVIALGEACRAHAEARNPGTVPAAPPDDEVSRLWGVGFSEHCPTPLGTMTRNALVRNGILTVSGLAAATEADLRDFRNFGAGCVTEARRVLAGWPARRAAR